MLKPVRCRHCEDQMDIKKIKKHETKWALLLMLVGVFCFFFIGGPVLGIPLIILGIYMYTHEMTICYCETCGYYYRVWMVEKDLP